MTWVLLGIVVLLALLLVAFDRWSKSVEDDLRGMGWKNTPIFGLVRRRVESQSRDLGGGGGE